MHEPHPTDYSLNKKKISYFSKRTESLAAFPPLLGWVSFLLLLNIYPRYHEIAWPILFLYFLPGLLFGWIIDRFRIFISEYIKKKHKLYNNYLNYRSAYSRWQAINSEEIEKRKNEQKLKLKKNDEAKKQHVYWWLGLDGRQFEREITKHLKKLGYNAKQTSYSSDGGVDVRVREEGKHIIIQCKAHKNFISPCVVRELYGTMIHERADEGWLITTSGFYSGARSFAHNKSIKLLTIKEVIELKSKFDK
ncbi:MAG: hypothetical protein GF353_12230 [Candidatus Lokiarchaeota archaeon]|nr:hypothetical protein [Candidatus Lokiarchaeota archaeon]